MTIMSAKGMVWRPRKSRCYAALIAAGVFITLVFSVNQDRTDEHPSLLTSGDARVLDAVEFRLPTPAIPAAWDGVWQNVTGVKHKQLVFSAFYERRDALPRGVRVVGVTRTKGSTPVWCRLWYDDADRESVTVPAHTQIIRENWKREYSACFFLCPLSAELSVPDSVSIVSADERDSDSPANRLRVVDNYDLPVEGPGKLAVCMKPLYNSHDPMRVIEFVELYSLLGVEHFTFYDNNTDASLRCLLDAYVRQGRVTLLPWDLPLDGRTWYPKQDAKGPDIWAQGIFAALNDCLYRSMYRYENAVMVDLDEFVIPEKATSLIELLDYMDHHLHGSRGHPTGSYNFRNAFFFRQWLDDPSITDVFERKLLTTTKTQRVVKLNPHNQRSKYICKPPLVVEVGNHFVWQYVTQKIDTVFVVPEMAKVHHYRVCTSEGTGCPKREASVTDRTTHRFKATLYLKVKGLWMDLKDSCKLRDS